jgi:hypothetical protein
MNLILYYKLSFLVSSAAATSLSIIGKHLIARSQVLEVFLLAQVTLIGNLISQLIFDHSEISYLSPLIGLILFFSVNGFYMLHRKKTK